MQKSIIILLLICTGGCTAKRFVYERALSENNDSVNRIVSKVRENNISNESFFIEKADVTISQNTTTTKFLFTVKYEKPDKFLISVRSSTGIEGVRIYLTKDTLLINDRFQKRLLYGKPKELEKLMQLPYFIVSMALGDLPTDENILDIKTEKINNQVVLTQSYQGMNVKSTLDPDVEKVKSVVFSDTGNKELITLKYSKYLRKENRIPGVIELKDYNRNEEAKIRLFRIQIPWNGKIEFIPGKGYSKEEI